MRLGGRMFQLKKCWKRKRKKWTVTSILARNRRLTTTTSHIPYMMWPLLRREGRKEERWADLENGKFSITTTSILHGVWALLLRYHRPLS